MIVSYLMNTDFLSDEKTYAKFYAKASLYRKKKIDRFIFRKDKNLSLGAAILMDIGLQAFGLREGGMEYLQESSGKPFFKDRPDIRFSVSHSDQMAMCTFSDSEIGCDIEKTGQFDLKIARRFFTPRENKYILSHPQDERSKIFCRIWALKESYIKMTGKGISMGLDSFEISMEKEPLLIIKNSLTTCFFTEYEIEGYMAAVCSHNEKCGVFTIIDGKDIQDDNN